jgi:uncharacterized Zn finger protein
LTSPLIQLCTPRHIAAITNARVFDRGVLYADEHRVRLERVDDVAAVAVVHGSERYRVMLDIDPSGAVLRGTCSCPMGGEGEFCKHCVATALVLADRRAEEDTAQLREFLAGWSQDRLLDLALEAISRDDRLRERVRLQMANADGVDADAIARAIDEAVQVDDFVQWQESWAYGERLDEILDMLDDLLADGHAELVRTMAERFLVALDGQIGRVHDSQDGSCSVAVERAEQLHRAACGAAPIHGPELAEWLLDVQLSSENELLLASTADYAPLLGDDGLHHYRELIDDALAKLPHGRPTGHDGARWRLTYLAEQLARSDGDVDRLVAILARDLSSGWQHLEIATVLDEAGREQDALEWAERGLAAGHERDTRLVDYLSARYRAAERREDALDLHVQRFANRPSVEDYRIISELAQALDCWPARRAEALEVLRAPPRDRWNGRRSTLVEILLWEGDVRAAWEEAQASGCRDEVWRQLARARVPARPADAVDVYRMLVGRTVSRADQRAYEAAVELLDELDRLLGAGAPGVLELVGEVRRTNHRKRNLLKLLDARWPA